MDPHRRLAAGELHRLFDAVLGRCLPITPVTVMSAGWRLSGVSRGVRLLAERGEAVVHRFQVEWLGVLLLFAVVVRVLDRRVTAVLDAERIAGAGLARHLLLQGDLVDPARAEVVLVGDLAASGVECGEYPYRVLIRPGLAPLPRPGTRWPVRRLRPRPRPRPHLAARRRPRRRIMTATTS
jgi:hypothetical protein